MKKPRPFSHSPIYINERRERLAEIEQRARRELGLSPSADEGPARLQGVFSRGQQHVRRHRQRGGGLSTQKMFLLIVLLFLIWKLLL